jgi:hypothetical protein
MKMQCDFAPPRVSMELATQPALVRVDWITRTITKAAHEQQQGDLNSAPLPSWSGAGGDDQEVVHHEVLRVAILPLG